MMIQMHESLNQEYMVKAFLALLRCRRSMVENIKGFCQLRNGGKGMKKTSKKIVALLFAGVMLMPGMSAYAAEPGDVTETVVQESTEQENAVESETEVYTEETESETEDAELIESETETPESEQSKVENTEETVSVESEAEDGVITDTDEETAITLESLYSEAQIMVLNRNVYGSITDTKNRYVYKITITDPGFIHIDFKWYMNRVHTSLYDINGKQLDLKELSWNSNIEQGYQEYNFPLEKGTYFWCIEKDYDNGAFDFYTTYESIGSNEKEPNNNIQNQYQDYPYSGVKINGMLGMGDESDFYRVQLKNSSILKINFKAYMERVNIYVYDKNGITVTYRELQGYGDRKYNYVEFETELLSAGIYYVQIKRYMYDVGKYELTLSSDGISARSDGWYNENGNTYYYRNGYKVTGWQTIGGNKYYFSQSNATPGRMATGFTQIGGKYYYFSAAGARKGQMLTGFTKIGSNTYYFRSWGSGTDYGQMHYGWLNANGLRYYFDSKGHMVKGWQTISNNMYYFSKTSGHMYTGFCNIPDINGGAAKYYYFSMASTSLGVRKIGLTLINGTYYYFEPYGITGYRSIGNSLWYFRQGKFVYKY